MAAAEAGWIRVATVVRLAAYDVVMQAGTRPEVRRELRSPTLWRMTWLAAWLVGAASLSTLANAAPAGTPVAVLSADVDGDGVADVIELGADGVVHISGVPRGDVRLAPAVRHGGLAVGQYRGRRYVVVELGGAPPAGDEAVILAADGGVWHEALRFPIGGVGLDHDYGLAVDATPDGIYRYQTRSDIRRCDGKPAYLFAEKFDGSRFRRSSALPSNVPDGAAVLPAVRDAAPAAVPLLYRAHAASLEIGAGDAGGLGVPRELDDGRLDTLWREDLAASTGEGQFFTFEPRAAGVAARQLRIVPGDPTSIATIRQFNRPRTIAIVAAHDAWRVELPDAANEPRGAAFVIDLPRPVAGCVTVVLEATYGPPQGTTAIAELEVFGDGERAAGNGEALLAHVVATDAAGAMGAGAALAGRGAAAASALEAELATTTDPGARQRLVAALVGVADPAAGPALVHAASAGWIRDQDLLDVIRALGRLGQLQALRDLAANAALPVAARVAAIAQLPATAAGFAALMALDEQLAGQPDPRAVRRAPGAPGAPALPARSDRRSGEPSTADEVSRELRRALIDRLSAAPMATLLAAAAAAEVAAAAGDAWRALTRSVRLVPANRAPVRAAMLAALPAASDYERRYRLVDGIAALGDAPALDALAAALRGLPPTAETAALRQVALRAIAAAPRAEAASFVLDSARDRDAGVRLAALNALAADGNASAWHASGAQAGGAGKGATDGTTNGAIDGVLAAAIARDGWPEVRRRAAAALGGRCSRPEPARALFDAVDHDADLGVRGDALGALVACRASGVAALLARIWDDAAAPLALRSRAVLEASALGDPALAATLVARFARWRSEAISSGDALALAQRAAATLGRLAPPGAAQALLDALEDTAFPEIVQSAALGLGALGAACPPAAKLRLAELARSDEQAAAAARRAAAQCGKSP